MAPGRDVVAAGLSPARPKCRDKWRDKCRDSLGGSCRGKPHWSGSRRAARTPAFSRPWHPPKKPGKNRWAELEREQRKSPKVCFSEDSDSVYRPESAGADSHSALRPPATIILHQRAVSTLRKALSSSGVPPAVVRFTVQTTGEPNAKAPPPLFSQGAGSAGNFHPLGSRGESSLTKGEGSGAPKGAGNISNALRRTPNDVGRSPRGAPLRRFP